MAANRRTLFRNGTIASWLSPGRLHVYRGDVLVDADRIAAVGTDLEAADALVVDIQGMLLVPGFINLHNHCVTTAACRGVTDDINRARYHGTMLYKRVFPLKRILLETLDDEDLLSVLRAVLYEVINSGTTTLFDQCTERRDLEALAHLAVESGLRMQLGRFLMSGKALPEERNGQIFFDESPDAEKQVMAAVRDYEDYNGYAGGLVTTWIGPHATDTCRPELLVEARRAADATGMRVTIHMSQVPSEMEFIRQKYGCTPTQYLQDCGLLGPDLVVAHATYANASDRQLLSTAGAHVAHCPQVFAKSGHFVPFYDMVRDSVNVGIGTDSYSSDMVQEVRAAALMGKLQTGVSDTVTHELALSAATISGAMAIGRADLGRIEAGMTADITVVDMMKPHSGPAYFPAVNMVYHSVASDIEHVMCNGRFIKRDGRVVAWDEARVARDAGAVMGRVWARAEAEGILP